MQLQATIHGPGDLRLDTVEEPRAGTNDILLRLGACGICGSDLGYVAQGGMPVGSGGPMALGHEFAGTIVQVGAAVRGLQPGQRVVVDPMRAGNIGNGGPEGAFTPLLRVREARAGFNVYPLPADMPFERAALVEPLAVALHAVNQATPRPDDPVVVYGAGCIGLGAVVALRRRGVRDIAVVDLSAERLARARALGARTTIDPAREPVAAALAAAHGASDVYGLPAVASRVFIEATGAGAVFEEIVRIAPVGARVVVVSLHKKPAALDLQLLLMKELAIVGSIGYPEEFPEVIAMLADPELDHRPILSHRFAFADFLEAFRTAQDAHRAAKVMVTF
jgi:2-desacetyl-2-hydroxyethyl bacteriochlorophyllide A dehydrogenase